jgi:hypothetical protein
MRLIACALLAGCGTTRVDGLVAGAEVDVQSATFAEVPGLFGEDGALLVWLLPGSNACGSLSRWLAVSESSRDPSELTNAWNGTFPSNFWEVDLVLRVGDPTVSAAGEWLEGTDWDANTEAAGEAYAELQHHLVPRDEAFFSGVVADPDAYALRWYSHRGLLQIHDHQPGKQLTGIFTTEAADPETGERQGEVAIRFRADHCADVEALLTRGG